MPWLLAAAACWTVCAFGLLASGRAGRQGRSMTTAPPGSSPTPNGWRIAMTSSRTLPISPRHARAPRRGAFATDDYLGKEDQPVVIGREEAAALLGAQAPIHFIFHSAFCASTMLVRALDVPGSAMGISEPVILNDMVGWRRRGAEIPAPCQGDERCARPAVAAVGRGRSGRGQAVECLQRAGDGRARAPPRRQGAAAPRADRGIPAVGRAQGHVVPAMGARAARETCSRTAWSTWASSRATICARPTCRSPASAGSPSTSVSPYRRQFGAARVATLDSETLTARPGRDRWPRLPPISACRSADCYATHPAIDRNSKSGACFAVASARWTSPRPRNLWRRDRQGRRVDPRRRRTQWHCAGTAVHALIRREGQPGVSFGRRGCPRPGPSADAEGHKEKGRPRSPPFPFN